MINYTLKVWKGPQGMESPYIYVDPPYSVLGDCSNIPNIPDGIQALKEVLSGERESYQFGWHRCGCYALADLTHVEDFHAEDLGTIPYFTVPTTEILKMLEDFQAFKEEYYREKQQRKKDSGPGA